MPERAPKTRAACPKLPKQPMTENTEPKTRLPQRSPLQAYLALTRLDRPIGIWLLMWPMLWALWFAAGGTPSAKILLIFVLGTVLTRSAGCAINDYADRDFDAHVARTKYRPLASGEISPASALICAAILMAIAFLLVLLTNRLTIIMSLVALLLASVYPFAKRYTHLPQVVLGIAFSWAIPMAYAAQTGTVRADAWLVFLASVLWAIAYDTEYAMADRDDDIKLGIKSTAILFGKADLFMVGLLQLSVLAILVVCGYLLGLGIIYFTGLIPALAMAGYQLHLIKGRQSAACIRAFLNNHYFGMVVFISIAIDYLADHPMSPNNSPVFTG